MGKTLNHKICLISSVPETLWYFYRSLPERLKTEGIEVEICSSSGSELSFFKDEYNVQSQKVIITRRITPLQDIVSLLKLVKLFRLLRFDIVHAHTPKAGLLGMIAAKLAGVKNRVYTCHGLPMETEQGLKKFILKVCEKITFKFATKVLVVSHSLLQKVREYGIDKDDKASVLLDGTACGIDLDRFTKKEKLLKEAEMLRKELGVDHNDILIGFIGRLVPDKGIGVLLDAFSNLCRSCDNIRLIVIGDYEPHRGKLTDQQIQLLRSGDKIIHVNFTYDIEKYYAAMDMLVLPTKREGFPYTLLEAAAMELPVVATKVTGCIDAVLDGQTGLLVESGDVQALSNAINKLIENPLLRSQMGRNARQRVEEKFKSERLLDAHLRLYHNLLRT